MFIFPLKNVSVANNSVANVGMVIARVILVLVMSYFMPGLRFIFILEALFIVMDDGVSVSDANNCSECGDVNRIVVSCK